MLLLKELSEALRPLGLLLSAALSPGRQIIEPAYDLEQIGKSVWGHPTWEVNLDVKESQSRMACGSW